MYHKILQMSYIFYGGLHRGFFETYLAEVFKASVINEFSFFFYKNWLQKSV